MIAYRLLLQDYINTKLMTRKSNCVFAIIYRVWNDRLSNVKGYKYLIDIGSKEVQSRILVQEV